ASMQAPAANNATTFSWQFRPVLGKSYVKAGMKQTFVQLSAPLRNGSACFGKIKVMTYWRQIDRKTGVLKKVIPESIEFPNVDRIIPVYDLTPFIDGRPTYDDLGSGQIRVTVPGKFLPGTFVRVGNNYYREGSAGFTADLNQIRFVASAAEVIKYKAYLVNRDGSETEIVSPVSGSSSAKFKTCNDEPLDTAGFSLSVADSDVTVTQGTQANFRVRVTAASNVSPTVQLSATGVPSPNGGTNWTVPGPAPAKGTAVSSIFSIDTTGTPVGTYVVQLQANGSPHKLQVVGVNLTVRAPVPQPTVQAAITSFDDTKSIVRAVVINRPVGPTIDEYLMVVNDKVFGLADAPLERDSDNSTFRAVVPTSLVSGPTKVQMIPLFWGEDYKTKPYYETSTLESTVDKVVVLDKTADPVVFLLYGSRLTTKVITHPGGVILNPLGNNPLTEIGTFTLSKAKWADTKQIVLQKAAAERPVFVTMPTPDPQTKIVLAVGGRVVVGTDELVVTGDTFDKLTAVKFNNGKTSIDKVVSDDKKSVKIVGLVGKGVTTVAGEPELVFEYDAGKKVTLKLDVVSSKIETVPRP
ncbi:MAG TPA: hypothetical protein VFB65_24035, partial [Pyrinomonadaceae bacterium]|nr:hypothetical protein [Pyrinomonadaceae bacterium]